MHYKEVAQYIYDCVKDEGYKAEDIEEILKDNVKAEVELALIDYKIQHSQMDEIIKLQNIKKELKIKEEKIAELEARLEVKNDKT